MRERKKKTPQQIAADAGVRFLNSKVDEIPDENQLSDMCEIGPEDDSFAVVVACIDVSKAVAWVIGARRLAAEMAKNRTWPVPEITMHDCVRRMQKLARERAARDVQEGAS